MHNPAILLLDEPANGLDPEGIVETRELLSELAEKVGVTIFISSHILGEISKFATRIGIIHEGMLIQESSMHEMEALRKRSLHVRTNGISGTAAILAKNGYPFKTTDNEILELTGEEAINNPGRVATLLVNSGFPPSLLKVDRKSVV